MITPEHYTALKIVMDRLQGQPVNWAVMGSLGMALQGMDLDVHDIDLQTDEAGAYAIERILAEYVVTPVRFVDSPRMRSYLGKLEIGGMEVEVIGDVRKAGAESDWDNALDLDAVRLWVQSGRLRVPVLSLEYEVESYQKMGRVEKAGRIRDFLAQRRRIEVVPYDSQWPEQFAEAAGQIQAVMGAVLLRIHHIGSTSIPGIQAKPVIDLLGEVSEIEAVDAFNAALGELGFAARGENGIPGRRYFSKKTGGLDSHHLHIFQAGNPEIARHLAFRDYLRAHPGEAAAYSHLKENLAEQYRYDPLGYTDAKSDFIREIDRKAAESAQGGKVAS